MPERKTGPDNARLDRVVAEARRAADERATGYRDRALKIYPWVCGRCSREFTRANLPLLEVHHRDHNHKNNPPDGSNWELLCLYCHDNEHGRNAAAVGALPGDAPAAKRETTGLQQPFTGLADLLKRKKDGQ